MAWTSVASRYKPNVSEELLLTRIFYFSSCSDCSSIYRLSCFSSRRVEVRKRRKKEENLIWYLLELKRKTFSHLSADSPYCLDTCFPRRCCHLSPLEQKTTQTIRKHCREFFMFLIKIISNCRIFLAAFDLRGERRMTPVKLSKDTTTREICSTTINLEENRYVHVTFWNMQKRSPKPLKRQ